MSEEQTEPMASSCSQYGSIPGGYQRGRVLPVLLSPPELPKMTIYTYICVTE